jgi:hypothetical protein
MFVAELIDRLGADPTSIDFILHWISLDPAMNAMARPRLIDWRPLHKNTLQGFAKVQFGSGLIVSEIAVHVVRAEHPEVFAGVEDEVSP